MAAQTKRAVAVTTTLSIAALSGGSMSQSMQEMTMEAYSTPADGAATYTVMVATSRQRPLNPGEPIKFDTTLDGQPVVTRSTTPFFDTCRVLAAWGMTGKVAFVNAADGSLRMSMLITEGAKLTVTESDGMRLRKFVAKEPAEVMASGREGGDL